MNLRQDQKQDIKEILNCVLIILTCAALILFSYWIAHADFKKLMKTQQEFHGPVEISETA